MECCAQCGHKEFDDLGNCLHCNPYGIRWLKEGTVLDGRYEIKKSIKAGGMGAVYQGYDLRLKQFCAVKEMHSHDEGNLAYLKKRFMEEAKLLADLRHNGIPRVTDYFTHENFYYLIMDYLDGVDLVNFIKIERDNRGLDEENVVKLAISVCDILIYLHNQKPKPVLHRDIKPSNIFLCKDERVMLIDFGLARPVNPESMTEKTIVGTVGYAPIEQYQGHPEPRSDLYALGGVMHFLLTAIQPSPYNAKPISEVRPDVSPWLLNIIRKALSLSPDSRFASALEMKEVLERKKDIGEYIEDSSYELEKIQRQFFPEDQSFTSRKGFLTQKKVTKEHTVKASFYNISEPAGVEKIMEMAEKGNEMAIEPLIEMISSEAFADKHRKIVELLGNFKDERVIEPLVKMLSHPDETIRRYAPMAIGKTGCKKPLKELCKLLKDPGLAVRKSALGAIGDLTDKNIMDFLSLFLTGNRDEHIESSHISKDLYFDSLEELIICLTENRELLKCYVHLSILYNMDGKFFEAEDFMKKALHIEEDNQSLRLFYVKILMKLEKYSEAEKHMKKIDITDNPDLQALYGEILACEGKYPEAIEIYDELYLTEQSDEREDKLRDLYYAFGRELEQTSKELALVQYEKAFMINPGYKGKDFFESLTLFKSGKIRKSAKILKKYMDENPQGKWYDKALKLMDEINSSPFPGIVPWIKDFLHQ